MKIRPIGMFDSGFGGLTVARATIDLLPNEDLVYLGDTARYPYGSLSQDDVQAYSMEIAEHLVDRYDIKLLVVACNTATAAALELLSKTLDVPVVGVIEAGVQSVVRASESGRFAVVGTFGTINSGAYDRAVAEVMPDADLLTCACPGFVEFVERGVTSGAEVELLARRLLAPLVDAGVDALLLGCTHYPYLARVIADAVGRQVVLVSSADETAFALADLMEELDLAEADQQRVGHRQFISSGDVRSFTQLGSRLLGPELTNATLWKPQNG